ncbi:MAG: hypothetical protein HGB36_05405 [Chlorobiaceae bacterium]|nr:hypothetical protein [Chlorobiaceae bacterium]
MTDGTMTVVIITRGDMVNNPRRHRVDMEEDIHLHHQDNVHKKRGCLSFAL